jgi:hypothetical protein
VDCNGLTYWFHPPEGEAYDPAKSYDLPEVNAAPCADVETRTPVYRALLGALRLSGEHRAALLARGLDGEAIRLGIYRTLPIQGRAKLAKELAERFSAETLLTVPGFYRKDEDDRAYLTLAGAAGLVFPVLDAEGNIPALRVRADDPGEDRPPLLLCVQRQPRRTGPRRTDPLPALRGRERPCARDRRRD